jgi:hypothetical protein
LIFQKVFVPADGVKAANCRRRRAASPFLGSSSDKPVLASLWLDGGAGGKAQQGRKIKCSEPSGGAGQRTCPAPRFIDPTLLFEGVPCPETSSITAPIAATAALAIIQAWPSGKLGSRSLGFDYLASIVETMLRLNPIING